jgi:2-isopropylmalate synthase
MKQAKSDRYVYLYDSTLRDGCQAKGVDLSVADKQAIAIELDKFGIDYIEGGWPGANPNDNEFFANKPILKKSILTAFGMTRRSGRSASNDPGLGDILSAGTKSICIVGKASDFQVQKALRLDVKENLRMISESISYLAAKGVEVIFDAEHFFDGYKSNPDYSLTCLNAALEAGARWLVLCDTNGGSLPYEIYDIISRISEKINPAKLGIHCHNDTENAVANSLEAVRAGVRQVQGTLNGIGERCGNANLVSIIPSLILKMGMQTGVDEKNLTQLTHISRFLDDRLNRSPNQHAAYVGAAAFAHKGGIHASAVAREKTSYEHINPELVGNKTDILVSDKAGKSNLAARLEEWGFKNVDDDQLAELLATIKDREKKGYSYEGAEASLILLAHSQLKLKEVEGLREYFKVISYRAMVERRFNARGKIVTITEATVKVEVNGEIVMTVAEGNGPVNALDNALRNALLSAYPSLADMRLVDYKVRIITPNEGTKAVTRVLIESRDGKGRSWNTVGVSANVIEASYKALFDAICYRLSALQTAPQ